MSKESSVGLKKIEVADVPATGLPTTWIELKAAVIGTATLSESAATKTPLRIEQAPQGVYRNLTTEYGVKTFVVSLYDVSADNLNKLKGGTVTPAVPGTSGKIWKSGRDVVNKEQAVRMTTSDGFIIILPRTDFEALIDWPMTVGDAGKVALTFTALLPADESLSDIQVQEPTPAV